MKLRSLGLRSDLDLLNGEIFDRGNYLLVRSPAEPNFYWGNLLVFPKPPKGGDFERWEALFEEEFRDEPRVLHRTFTWDISEDAGDTEAFSSSGYRLEHSVVLKATKIRSPRFPNRHIDIRSPASEVEWLALEDLEMSCRDEGHEEAHYREYIQGRLKGYRKRIDAGQGQWLVAFLAGQMVASLGVFRCEDSARFQAVITHPDFRRQGICGTLVHQAAIEALAHPDTDSLLMIADAEYHAARIYESLGFTPAEKLHGLCRWPT